MKSNASINAMEAFRLRVLSSSRSVCSRGDADTYAAAETRLYRRHDGTNAWRFQIDDDDEILVRARAIGEDRADAAAYRETPARLREWVEKKTRQGVDSTAVMIHRITSRDAAGAVDLQSHVAAEWQIRADASLQRPGLRRAHVDRVDTQFERCKRRTRRWLRARRGRELVERLHRA